MRPVEGEGEAGAAAAARGGDADGLDRRRCEEGHGGGLGGGGDKWSNRFTGEAMQKHRVWCEWRALHVPDVDHVPVCLWESRIICAVLCKQYNP